MMKSHQIDLKDSVRIQEALWDALKTAGLPLKVVKCTPRGYLEHEEMVFIGYVWNFASGLVMSKDEILNSVSTLAHFRDERYTVLSLRGFQRLVGKLI